MRPSQTCAIKEHVRYQPWSCNSAKRKTKTLCSRFFLSTKFFYITYALQSLRMYELRFYIYPTPLCLIWKKVSPWRFLQINNLNQINYFDRKWNAIWVENLIIQMIHRKLCWEYDRSTILRGCELQGHSLTSVLLPFYHTAPKWPQNIFSKCWNGKRVWEFFVSFATFCLHWSWNFQLMIVKNLIFWLLRVLQFTWTCQKTFS